MSEYIALYRRLRPTAFSEMVGQEHIVRTLTGQIKTGRLSHAYLFCGTRGTGKTSAAKILARAVNCENPREGEPCGVCELCMMSADKLAMTVYEIDAASNNGVDNIRELIETVKYPPTLGKYKVYIIDEAHMLSAGAFNALLKTLEEPPPHVIFVLATTEPHKILPTIQSRCQRFDFRRILVPDMVKAMRGHTESDGVAITDDALVFIARSSDGAMRDCLSILDQCVSFFPGEEITLEKVQDVLGAAGGESLFALTDAIYGGDAQKCIEIIAEAVARGRDIRRFAAEFVEHLRNVVVAKTIGKAGSPIDYSLENAKAFFAQGKKMEKESLLYYISLFSELQGNLRFAANPRVLLEVAALTACNPPSAEKGGDGLAALHALEMKIEKQDEKIESIRNSRIVYSARADAAEAPPVAAPAAKREKAVPKDIEKVIEGWPEFTRGFASPVREWLGEAKPAYLSGNCLNIVCEFNVTAELLEQEKNRNAVLNALSEKFGKEFDVKITTLSEHNSAHVREYGVADNIEGHKKLVSDLGLDAGMFS